MSPLFTIKYKFNKQTANKDNLHLAAHPSLAAEILGMLQCLVSAVTDYNWTLAAIYLSPFNIMPFSQFMLIQLGLTSGLAKSNINTNQDTLMTVLTRQWTELFTSQLVSP